MLVISLWSNYALIQIQSLCQSPFNVFLLVEHIDPMNCRDYWIVVRIPVVIVLLMVMVIAVVCCRKKENRYYKRSNVLIVAASN